MSDEEVTLLVIQASMSQVEDDVFLMAKQAFDGEDEEDFVEAALAMLKKNAILDSLLRMGLASCFHSINMVN